MRSVGSCVRPGRRATKGPPQISHRLGFRGAPGSAFRFFFPLQYASRPTTANHRQIRANNSQTKPQQIRPTKVFEVYGFCTVPLLFFISPVFPSPSFPLRLCRQGEVADFAVLVRSGRLRQLRCLGAKAEEDKLQADGLGGSLRRWWIFSIVGTMLEGMKPRTVLGTEVWWSSFCPSL